MPTHHVAFRKLENLFDVQNSPRRTDQLQRVLQREPGGGSGSDRPRCNGSIHPRRSVPSP